jgi:hypothetical protein
MRWGLLAFVAALTSGGVIVACDQPQHDTTVRYYVPPDAAPDDTPPPGPTPGGPDDGGPGNVIGDAASDALGGDAGLALALPGWWRAPFAASPWVGTASGGTSGTQNLAAGAGAPIAGATLGGFATADFNGINSVLTSPAPLSSFVTTTAFSGWALVSVDTINTNSTTWSQNDAIVCSAGTGQFGVYLRDDGAGNVTVGLATFNGVDHTVSTAFAKTAWQLVQWRSNGTTMSIRVNGNAWASTDTLAIQSVAPPLDVGRNPGQNQFFDGRIADLGLTTVMLSDAEFDAIRAYATTRYGEPF